MPPRLACSDSVRRPETSRRDSHLDLPRKETTNGTSDRAQYNQALETQIRTLTEVELAARKAGLFVHLVRLAILRGQLTLELGFSSLTLRLSLIVLQCLF